MIRIIVVDDHPIVREGLVAALTDEKEFKVVGAVGSAEDALLLVAAQRPDVILLDLELPGQSGLEAIPKLRDARPQSKILILTAYDTDERVIGALRAGAQGYLLKGASLEEIARAIRSVHAGGSYLAPRIASKVVGALSPRAQATALSDREREVLRLVADGQANKRIARTLGITERTVKFHVTSILNKLGAENRAQAVSLATRRGLL
jgi:DNA-binding NarL/FixJ family response regulator